MLWDALVQTLDFFESRHTACTPQGPMRPRTRPVVSDSDDDDHEGPEVRREPGVESMQRRDRESAGDETESDASGSESDSEETESDDSEEGSFHFDLQEGFVPRAKKASPAANGGLPNYSQGEYDKEYWHCEPAGKFKRFVRMKDTTHGGEYIVPLARVNKALRFLHLPSVAASLRACDGLCRCKREPKCYKTATTLSILEHRHTYFQQLDEAGATKFLADQVRSHNTITSSSSSSSTKGGTPARKRFKWLVDGKEVCDDFFRSVYGVSKDKMKGVRRLIAGEGTIAAPRVREERPQIKFAWCKCFWFQFFKLCQRPNATTRLFPVNQSYPTIYEDFFQPWFKHTLPAHVVDMPCLGWLIAARHDPMFGDVKNRPKHHHCRCLVCANLQARRMKAFNNEFDKEQYQLEWQDHQNEKRGWRDCETGGRSNKYL